MFDLVKPVLRLRLWLMLIRECCHFVNKLNRADYSPFASSFFLYCASFTVITSLRLSSYETFVDVSSVILRSFFVYITQSNRTYLLLMSFSLLIIFNLYMYIYFVFAVLTLMNFVTFYFFKQHFINSLNFLVICQSIVQMKITGTTCSFLD